MHVPTNSCLVAQKKPDYVETSSTGGIVSVLVAQKLLITAIVYSLTWRDKRFKAVFVRLSFRQNQFFKEICLKLYIKESSIVFSKSFFLLQQDNVRCHAQKSCRTSFNRTPPPPPSFNRKHRKLLSSLMQPIWLSVTKRFERHEHQTQTVCGFALTKELLLKNKRLSQVLVWKTVLNLGQAGFAASGVCSWSVQKGNCMIPWKKQSCTFHSSCCLRPLHTDAELEIKLLPLILPQPVCISW